MVKFPMPLISVPALNSTTIDKISKVFKLAFRSLKLGHNEKTNPRNNFL